MAAQEDSVFTAHIPRIDKVPSASFLQLESSSR